MTDKQATTYDDDRILTGQANWLRWYLQFEHNAYTEGLETLFDGTEVMLTRPVRDKYINQTFTATNDNDSDNDITASTASGSTTGVLPNDLEAQRRDFAYKIQLDLYHDDLAEFEKQQDRLRRANKLLFQRVDPSIQPEIFHLRNPHLALEHLRERYKMKDSLAIHIATVKIDNVMLASCRDMATYLCEMRRLRRDLEALRAPLSDYAFLCKVVGGISWSHDAWREWYRKREADSTDADSVKSVEDWLIYEEAMRSFTTEMGKG